MADADEDAIRGPSTEFTQVETDLSDETQDFRLLNHLNLYVPGSQQAKCEISCLQKSSNANLEIFTASPTHPLVSPAAGRKTSSLIRLNSKPMSSPPRARRCTMRSPIRASITPKTRLSQFTRLMDLPRRPM